jgi:RNA methyltransferase, TrmH family
MGLMMLGAAMGDSIVIHAEGDGADESLEKLVQLVEERIRGRGGIMPREVTGFLQHNRQAAALAPRQEGAARRGMFLAEGLRIIAEARDSGACPRSSPFPPRVQASARRRHHRRDRGGRRRGDRDHARNPFQDERQGQSADAARRLSPAGYRAGADRPLRRADLDRRPGASRPGQYRDHLAHRRRSRRRRADPDRRMRRPLLGRGGARVDGRSVHSGDRDGALGDFLAWLRSGEGQLVGTSLKAADDYLDASYESPASC